MKIICDYREHSIYNCLVKKIESCKNYENILVEKTNLNIGDFVIGQYMFKPFFFVQWDFIEIF